MAYVKDTSQDQLDAQGNPIQTGGEASPEGGDFSGITSAMGQGQPNTNFTQTNTATGKKILEKNTADQGNQYDVTAPYKENVDKGYANIGMAQQEHQQALAGDQNSRAFSNEQVAKAVAGNDTGEFSNLSNILTNPVSVSKYKNPEAPGLQDVNALNTSIGLQGELQRQAAKAGNYNYSRGQSSLDAALLGRNPGANEAIADVQKKYGDLYGYQSKVAGEEAQKEAEAARQIGLQQEALRGQLTNWGSNLTDQASLRASSAQKSAEGGLNQKYQDYINKYISGLDNSNTRISDAQKQAIRNATGNSGYMPGSVESFLASTAPQINMNDYLNGTQQVGNLYNTDELGQYNRLAQLLGKGFAPPANTAVTGKDIDFGSLTKRLNEISGIGGKGAQDMIDAENRVASQKAEADRVAAEQAQREEERKQNRPGGIKDKADQVEPGNIAPKVIQNWMGQGNTNVPDLGTKNITGATQDYSKNAVYGQGNSDYQRIIDIMNGNSPGESGVIPNAKRSAGNMNPIKYL